MATISPAILAGDEQSYHKQMENIANFASRIQIDLTDGRFADSKTVTPEDAWWPVGFKPDFHLMFYDPLPAIKEILEHQAHMIIVHAEAEGDFTAVKALCRENGVKVGVALLPQTNVEVIQNSLNEIDHVLIFSGDLGHFGGQADTALLGKVTRLKQLRPELEVGWDGGINEQNIAELVLGGVDVLNVGGYIQESENPEKAFLGLQRIAEETGTT